MTEIATIIITYNHAVSIGATLRSLFHGSRVPSQVFCLDNASKDRTAEIVANHRSITLARNDCNIGFSGGCNRGIQATDAPFVFFLNPDVVLAPDCLSLLHDALASAPPDVAAVFPKLLRPVRDNRPAVIDSTGIAMHHNGLVPADRGFGEIDRQQYDRTEPFGPSGACMLFRRDALARLSVAGEIFDEDFFAYYEDVDLAWRARNFGYRFHYLPAAAATHDRKNPGYYTSSLQGRADVNRLFCVLKNHRAPIGLLPQMVAANGPRLLWHSLAKPGYSAAISHLWRNYPRMLYKRRLVMGKATAPEALSDFL